MEKKETGSSGKTDTADRVKVFIDTCHSVFMWRFIQIRKNFTILK